MQEAFSHVKKYFRWYVLLSLFFIFCVVLIFIFNEKRDDILKFAVLDVGQGDALFIESPTGVQVLVDGGPNNNLSREISKVMPFYDRHIDMIVVTNPDLDHYSGFLKILDKYKVDYDLESGTTNKYSVYAELENKIKEKGIKKIIAKRGQIIDLGGGAYLQILFPDRDISGMSSNDGSIVMKLVYGETNVMLQGDSTAKIEDYLLRLSTTTLKSTILKAGHHGSKTSSKEAHVSIVNPKWIVISSGKNNDYGHPHKETLQTAQNLKIPAIDTCNNGTIFFESDGINFFLKNKVIKEAVVGCKSF